MKEKKKLLRNAVSQNEVRELELHEIEVLLGRRKAGPLIKKPTKEAKEAKEAAEIDQPQ